jgi:hypothetical protein
MKSYGIEMQGEFVIQKVATLPAWGASDEGRIIYVEDEDKLYYANNTEWSVSGGGGLAWELISTDTNAESGKGYLINATSGDKTLTLPASPSSGDTVGVCDSYKKATTNTITVARNSENIAGIADDLTIDIDGAGFTLVYVDATRGWDVVDDVGFGEIRGLLWEVQNSDFNATAGTGYMIDASANTVTATMPASPSIGHSIAFCDYKDQATTYAITIEGNTKNIEGSSGDFLLDVNGAGFTFVYADVTRGWEIVSEVGAGTALLNIVEDLTPQLGGNLDLNSKDLTGVLTVKPDGTNEVLQVNDGTVDFTDGNAGTTGTVTINSAGNISYNKNFSAVDIDGIIGSNTPAAGSFTTVDVDGGTIDGTTIGGVTPAAGTFYGATLTAALSASDEVILSPEIKDYSETVYAHGSISAPTQFDLEEGNVHTFTVGGACAVDPIGEPTSGKAGSLTLIITNGGSDTVTWGSGEMDWVSGLAPSLTVSGVDLVTLTTIDAGTTWLGFVVGLDVKSPA